MKLQGAIFDLDGTLLDSMFIWSTIGEEYLRSRGIAPREKLNEIFKNMSLLQAAQYYQTEYNLQGSTQEIMDGVNRMIWHYYEQQVQPKAGVVAVLQLLKQHHIKMCVATATDEPLAKIALQRTGLLPYFKKILTCGDIGHGKDEPDIYHAARRCLQTPQSGTWVFEDALHAAQTAKNAGYPVIGVYDPAEKNADALRGIADYYIHSFEEMEALLHEKGVDDCGF